MGAIEVVASRITACDRETLIAVAIDGGDAAGKATFVDRLAEEIRRERPVIRVAADHFEHPRSIRYRRGAVSAEGYYEDTYDYDSLEALLLAPFRDAQPVVTGINDWHADTPLELEPMIVATGCVLIMAGALLLRARIRDYFDLKVFLDVGAEVRLERSIPRQLAYFGSEAALIDRFRTRYLPGFEPYEERERPRDHADLPSAQRVRATRCAPRANGQRARDPRSSSR